MRVAIRYRKTKPETGHFSLRLPENAMVLSYTEHWDLNSFEWITLIDVLEEERNPREERWFFLCNNGDSLDFLGEHGDLYYVSTYWSKGYSSHLWETTHLTEEERAKGKVDPKRFRQNRPHDVSRTAAPRERPVSAAGSAASSESSTPAPPADPPGVSSES